MTNKFRAYFAKLVGMIDETAEVFVESDGIGEDLRPTGIGFSAHCEKESILVNLSKDKGEVGGVSYYNNNTEYAGMHSVSRGTYDESEPDVAEIAKLDKYLEEKIKDLIPILDKKLVDCNKERMTNEQRLAVCQAIHGRNNCEDYSFRYKNEKGEYYDYKINQFDGSWVDVESEDKSDHLDSQLFKDGVKARNKLTNILRGIRPE